MKKRFDIKTSIIILIIVFGLLGGIGSLFTSKNTNSDWYNSIKPDITPPSFVFPIVWNILFLLISISLYFAWTNSKTKQNKKKIIFAFGINFILNILWSILFFALKLPKLAFAEIILLWISIGAMIFVTRKINKVSSWLILPYWLWVTFAGVLNFIIAF